MASTKGRVMVSRNPEELLKLADKVYKKHVADGAASDLNNLDADTYNWAKVGPTIAPCLQFHDLAERLKGEMEEAYRQRDALFASIDEHVKGSSAYLKGKYAKQPKKLGNWGFEVDDTPKAAKKKA
ncbi:MAG: hypothetical protein QM541_08040 [Flavobacterium sp.]|nr:hypothetical protein [Flavobacterium sp.]